MDLLVSFRNLSAHILQVNAGSTRGGLDISLADLGYAVHVIELVVENSRVKADGAGYIAVVRDWHRLSFSLIFLHLLDRWS